MSKGITAVRMLRGAKELKARAELLESLGLERLSEWKSGRSHGVPFALPAARLEIIEGKEQFPSDVWVEVTDLDSVRELLKKRKIKFLSDIQETNWNSRTLVIAVSKGVTLAFWQKNQPTEDAIEGELNAAGMRFAIVVSRWNSFITERLMQGALD